jgi:hypothetical protein
MTALADIITLNYRSKNNSNHISACPFSHELLGGSASDSLAFSCGYLLQQSQQLQAYVQAKPAL